MNAAIDVPGIDENEVWSVDSEAQRVALMRKVVGDEGYLDHRFARNWI